MTSPRFSTSIGLLVGLLAATVSATVNMETVPVGNPGNEGELSGESADSFGPNRICGSLHCTYNTAGLEMRAG